MSTSLFALGSLASLGLAAGPAGVGLTTHESATTPVLDTWVTVTPYGAHVAGQAGGLLVMTTAWGRDGATEPVDASTVRSRCAEAGPNPIGLSTGCEPVLEREITGGVEQWQHRVDGVKQTWVLDQKPEGQGPVVIELEAQGGILSVEPQSFTVRSQSGDQSGDSWRIDRLVAWDVTGRALRSWFERDGDVVRVMVDDTDAHWPVTVDPVITPANQVITNPGSTDFGIGVAMGRFNADGYADMLVGARFGVNLFGQAFSYHGSAAGMNATIRWSRTGPTSYGKFGEYVATGDINGDGRDDAVVCEFYDEKVYVYFSDENGVTTGNVQTVTGAYGLGRGLATGDFNGDGKDDVLAGSTEPGAFWYLGSSTGIITTAANSLLTTEAPGVAAAARLNNDVYADAIVGDPGQAHVKVIYGSASAIGSTATLTVPSSVRLGESVAGLGDVNGDGYDEVLAGDPAFSTNTGQAVIFWGSSTGVSSANRSIVAAPVTGSGFGATVFPAGDVNNDGLADFGVSDGYNHGKVYIFHGQAGGFNATPVNTLDVGDNNLGYSAAGGDDVNGDGFDDVILGSIGNGVRVYHGCADLDSDGSCAPADCADGDPNRKPGAPETCDGVDNDCDGNTDEGPLADAPSAGQAGCWNNPGNCCSFGGLSWCPPPGASCSGNGTLLSPCNRGLLACSGGAWVCANVVAPSAEVCDFVDNNCDGSLDNVAGIGSACSVGVGACESPGITACGEGGIECLGNPGNPTVEVCNGLDDDCNETPDDGFPDLGEPCYVGQGLCGNEGYRVCKADGTGTECDATPFSPEIEVCNFADDDCNGIDDDVLGVGLPCVVGTGICASPGITECGEVGVYCAGEPGPSDEVETCNGLDDDCDGATDEDFSVGSPCDGLDEDNCPTGEVVCFEGGSTCLEIGQGGVELCDGLDNDCDEDVDEDFPEVGDECSVGIGACENFGEVQCTVSGTGTACSAVVGTPGAEVCNGFDDDCNEVVDDAPGVGDECVVGTGICAAPGVQVCGEGGLYCAGNPFPGLESESCNGLDDNCDGETDEGFGIGAPCDGPDIGSCAGGVIACAGPDETTCMGDQGGEIEYCNGVDDDCDEETDETFLDLGQSCTVGTGACQAPGVRECHPSQQDTYCAGVEGEPTVEVCNGIDDDCDEDTDNVEGAGDECTVGTGVCAAPGVQVCGEGGLYCAGNPFPGLELEACNGLDDDCDGETDEDFAVGSPCDGDDGDTCALGVIACLNDVSVCDETAAVGVELCNGIDDDCDEDVDEDFTTLGEACTVGTGTCTAAGEWVCDVSGTGTTCEGTAGTPGTETCNGLDDDCNGETDDAPGVGDACSVGVGACAASGTQQCGEGGLECNAQPLPPAESESCNAIDDDCDGDTDEGFGLGAACDGADDDQCKNGETVCTADGTGTECGAEAPSGVVEACNGEDDDCDGETDEGFELGAPCSSGTGACVTAGETVCAADGLGTTCGAVPAAPGTETCNGEDDDCDGETDDDIGLGAPCTVGVGACARTGEQICSTSGQLECGQVAGQPQAEACNGEDDDCDGVTDNATTSTGQVISACDLDQDGLVASEDNCPDIANADQADFDDDGNGNACDPIDDGLRVHGTSAFCDGSGRGDGDGGRSVLVVFGALAALVLWRRRGGAASGLFAVALLGAGVADAQKTPPIRFHEPLPGGDTNLVSISTAKTLLPWEWAVTAHFDWGLKPLVLSKERSGEEVGFVNHWVGADALVALGFPAGLELGLHMPFVTYQVGESGAFPDGRTLASSALGDLKIVPKWQIWKAEQGFGVALLAPFSAPTGDADAFAGAGAWTVEPRLAMDYDISDRVRLALHLGYLIREQRDFFGLTVGNELRYGVGVEGVLVPGRLNLIGEVIGKMAADGDSELSLETAPLEVDAALRIYAAPEHSFIVGAGLGLTEGYGTPTVHVYGSYSYTGKPDPDTDLDGLKDPEDACPTDPEDFDEFEDRDGCPELDNDKDGILDLKDGALDKLGFGQCRNQPEDKDGFEDEDGCPDPDNDRDGVPDVKDGDLDKLGFGVCRDQPEDKDAFEDENGCPDPDNDQDTVLDVNDGDKDETGFGKCRNQPEVVNGIDDEDGCPDERVKLKRETIDVLDKVNFDTNKATLRPEAPAILDQVVKVLADHPELLSIEIQGHTDERNTDAYNMRLSQRRAETVRKYLIKNGISEKRLTAKGYGESQPVVRESNADAWYTNRRVVFQILERAPEPE